ncbi:MAG: hypothetical protein IJ083_05535 [Clostridia bacterium]|nr:hypothetical protein [Clostridia bacterium]
MANMESQLMDSYKDRENAMPFRRFHRFKSLQREPFYIAEETCIMAGRDSDALPGSDLCKSGTAKRENGDGHP